MGIGESGGKVWEVVEEVELFDDGMLASELVQRL